MSDNKEQEHPDKSRTSRQMKAPVLLLKFRKISRRTKVDGENFEKYEKLAHTNCSFPDDETLKKFS